MNPGHKGDGKEESKNGEWKEEEEKEQDKGEPVKTFEEKEEARKGADGRKKENTKTKHE